MDRRSFLRTSCMACAGVFAASSLPLQGCATQLMLHGTMENGQLRIPADQLAGQPMAVVREASLPYDILVVPEKDGGFRALYLRCTHRDQPVSASASGLHCPTHGSRFALDGTVLHGPATRPLTTFPVARSGNDLLIDLKPIHS
jgi:cytochrome b6-f complex iron-sulfur subunit